MKKMKLRLTIFDGVDQVQVIIEREFNDIKHAAQDLFNTKSLIVENTAYQLSSGPACLTKIELLQD